VKVLISGGAGYIGSTIGSACLDAGITPVILDSLVTGRPEFAAGRIFYEGDIADAVLIDRIFDEHEDIEAVVHCAALISVPASVADPIGYYRANVVKSLDFFESLIRNGCGRVVFSSSASIYKASSEFAVDEDSAMGPMSPYARTKVVCEEMFADIASGSSMRVLSLRYFNPIGADPQLRSGLQLPKPTHALGMMITAAADGLPFPITGTDFPTRDGSGIRDYIHVWDLADAHIRALSRFDDIVTDDQRSVAINLGTGRGTTVRELFAAFNEVSEKKIEAVEAPRRPGDAAGAFTHSARARQLLDWEPRHSIAEGIRHTLDWFAVRDRTLF